jgi:hypothetical protein
MSTQVEPNVRRLRSLKVLAVQSLIILLITMLPCLAGAVWLAAFAGSTGTESAAQAAAFEVAKTLLYWMAGLSLIASLSWFSIRYNIIKRLTADQAS